MGCASIKWSVLRAYATLRNFVSPDLALQKMHVSGEPLVLLRQDLLPLKTWGGLLSPLATVRVHFPQVSGEPSGRSQS